MMGSRGVENYDFDFFKLNEEGVNTNTMIGHDLVTGEFPYTSNGYEILIDNPRNAVSLYKKLPETKTSLKFYERPSKLTESEKAGLPKHERTNVVKPENYYSHPDRKIPNEYPASSKYNQFESDVDYLNDKKLNNDWINYINSLSDDINPNILNNKQIIEDYRLYLSNLGYKPNSLSDVQIAKLISNQYDQLVSG
jgi:hypothetical protein